jgi:UDPglucose 6-dehydrogenase
LRIVVVGAGYVGLVAAACLAQENQVVVVEKNHHRLEKLHKGQIPFFEEGLEGLVGRGLQQGTLHFSCNLREALPGAEILLIAVGTPSLPDGRVDLSQVHGVMADIVPVAEEPLTVVMKSTVPPGLGRELVSRYFSRDRCHLSYVSNPEFLREGKAVYDWFHPDRIIIGSDDIRAAARVEKMYRGIEAPVLTTDITSAEMIKYAANAFLATKISFINEIASLCEMVEADCRAVARGVGMDGRIGPHYLRPGLGYGGSCFPKDTMGLDYVSTFNGHSFNLLKAVIEVNARQRFLAVRKIKHALRGLLGRRIAVLGLAFKPQTDDVRESQSVELARLLVEEGAEVVAYDPLAMENASRVLPPSVHLAPTAVAAVAGCHCVVLATEWEQFIQLDWPLVRKIMQPPYLVLDAQNSLCREQMVEWGFRYTGIGSPLVEKPQASGESLKVASWK